MPIELDDLGGARTLLTTRTTQRVRLRLELRLSTGYTAARHSAIAESSGAQEAAQCTAWSWMVTSTTVLFRSILRPPQQHRRELKLAKKHQKGASKFCG